MTRLAIIVVVALKYGLDEFLTGHERFRAVRPAARALTFWRDTSAPRAGAPAARAGGARPDLRQVRPDALDPAGPAAAGHRRRAREAAGPRAAVSAGAGACHADAALRQARRLGVPVVRVDAHRERLGRAGPFRGAAGRHAGRRQGAAAEHRAGDREGHLAAARGRAAGGEAVVRRQAAAPARGGRRVREDAAGRARPHARGGELLAASPQLRALAAPARPRRALGLLRHRSDGDGAHGRHSDRAGGPAARGGRGHPAARARRRRGVLHAGVPRRLLPCRHASRQHLRRHGSAAPRQVHRRRFRDHGHAVRARPELSRAEFPRLLPARLPSRRDRAPGIGLGARPTPAWTSSRRKSASCWNRCSTGRSPRSRSGACCCSSSARRAGSTSRSSRSSCSCRRRCSTSKASAGSSTPNSTSG